MMDNERDEQFVKVIVAGIGAGAALIGILACRSRAESTDRGEQSVVDEAWRIGDKMAAKFIERAKAYDEEGAN